MKEKTFFKKILQMLKVYNKQLSKDEETRENVIKYSRKILKNAKKSIFLINDYNFKKAKEIILNNFDEISKLVKKYDLNILYKIGVFNEALEEFMESYFFYNFLVDLFNKDERFYLKELDDKSLKFIVNYEIYIKGLCDSIGELVRVAVKLSIKDRIDEVMQIEQSVRKIYFELLHFTSYSGSLRNKIDSVKWNLNKIEEIVFKYKMR